MQSIKTRLLSGREKLVRQCQSRMQQSGLDGRTNYFSEIVNGDYVFPNLRKWTRLSNRQIAQLLRGFLGERFVSYAARRDNGIVSDIADATRILSQGYKRGLTWRGVALGKTCFDVCIYQQLIQDLKPQTIVEFGTGLGASTMFLADTCRNFGLTTRVISLDLNSADVDPQLAAYGEIEFIEGDSKDIAQLLPSDRLQQLPHPWLVVEDCHVNVPEIVAHLTPAMAAGDYLVIEDIGHVPEWSRAIDEALAVVPEGAFEVDTDYTDLFGRNATCSADAIFRRTQELGV